MTNDRTYINTLDQDGVALFIKESKKGNTYLRGLSKEEGNTEGHIITGFPSENKYGSSLKLIIEPATLNEESGYFDKVEGAEALEFWANEVSADSGFFLSKDKQFEIVEVESENENAPAYRIKKLG